MRFIYFYWNILFCILIVIVGIWLCILTKLLSCALKRNNFIECKLYFNKLNFKIWAGKSRNNFIIQKKYYIIIFVWCWSLMSYLCSCCSQCLEITLFIFKELAESVLCIIPIPALPHHSDLSSQIHIAMRVCLTLPSWHEIWACWVRYQPWE